MAIYPAAASTDTDLYISVNNAETNTTSALGTGETTIPVNSTTNFPSDGFITIGTEAMQYTGKTATTFTGVTRGADGTTAITHLDNAVVIHSVIAAHHNVLKEEIKAIEAELVAHFDLTGANTIANTQIQGIDGTPGVPCYAFLNDGDSGFYLVSNNIIAWSTDGSERMRIDNLGNIAIGGVVTTPDSQLHVASSDASAVANGDAVATFENNGNCAIQILAEASSIGSILFGDTGSNIDGFVQYNFNSQSLIFGAASASKLTINSSGQLLGLAGTAAAPTYSFTGNIDLGIYNNSGDLGITTNGSLRLSVTSGGQTLVVDGSTTTPGLSFLNDTNTGIFRVGSDEVAITTGGTSRFNIGTGAIDINLIQRNSAGTASDPSLTFSGDTDTGIFRSGADILGFSAGGTEVARLDASATAGDTRFIIYDVDNGQLERVTVGAADSGGSGFKVLRIPN